MRGVFNIVRKEEMELALSVTATLKEWREVYTHLTGKGDAGRTLANQIADLIRHADNALATNSWTTGYATGVETPKEES